MGREEPFQLTTELATKDEPFTVRVNAAPPAAAEVGEMVVRAGTGFCMTDLLLSHPVRNGANTRSRKASRRFDLRKTEFIDVSPLLEPDRASRHVDRGGHSRPLRLKWFQLPSLVKADLASEKVQTQRRKTAWGAKRCISMA